MTQDPTALARASYQAYVDKDRAALDALLTADFHFTSPLDNHLDRVTYCKRCWPNSQNLERFGLAPVSWRGECLASG
jgi:ketosteroid isomerase-like protein